MVLPSILYLSVKIIPHLSEAKKLAICLRNQVLQTVMYHVPKQYPIDQFACPFNCIAEESVVISVPLFYVETLRSVIASMEML